MSTSALSQMVEVTMKGPGRRPEVDFAFIEDDRTFRCVLESKWVGSGGLSAEEIIWDLLRLELVAHETGADAYFLLAGKRRHLNQFFESKAFKGKEHDGKFRRLLKLDRRMNPRLRVDNPPSDRLNAFKKVLGNYGSIAFPSRISTSHCYGYPTDVPNFQYQAFVWRVFTPPETPRFKPNNHSVYAGGGEEGAAVALREMGTDTVPQ